MSRSTVYGAKLLAPIIASLAFVISGPASAAGDQEEGQELKDYAALAAANDDALSWLGPLPVVWSMENFESRTEAVVKGIEEDLKTGSQSQEPTRFKCRSPGEVGPVPNMAAVNDYLMGFPKSARDKKIIDDLYAAGRAGNWLAVMQIYMVETQIRMTENEYLRVSRILQLMEWLHARKVGGLYQEIGLKLPAARFFNDDAPGGADSVTLYAAMHESYPAQYKVGKRLLQSPTAELRDIGQRMIDCATSALPGYAKLLNQ